MTIDKEKQTDYKCALCGKHICEDGDFENMDPNCPSLDDLQADIKELYTEPENLKIAHNSALVESEGYCQLTRLEEIMLFAKKSGFKKLGLAFCVGFSREAASLHKILTHNGFNLISAICKNGSIPKEFIDLKDEEKLRPGEFEAMCNPIGQALLLNKSETELNIIMGLCVGHDSLFMKYSQAPVTVFAVKDRVLGHNPIAALYLSNSYYKKKLYKEKED